VPGDTRFIVLLPLDPPPTADAVAVDLDADEDLATPE
jgi:hypothetical protein